MFKTARFLRYSKCSKTTIDYTKTFLTFTTQKANAFSHWTACVSAINAPQYKLAKSLVLILKSLTSNKYTMKDSFAFAEEIVEQDSEFFKGSLDVILFYPIFHLQRLLAFALIHFLNILKE